jgi:DNA invertase Pin-like site-specific DNA recombinase
MVQRVSAASPAFAPQRAAQYLRMSTDQQKYSLLNQGLQIAAYAQTHDLEIVRTYQDAGKSGLTFEGREGLQSLMRDVVTQDRPFDLILVLDVSRWGRFQDPDQGAHYEFVCQQAGARVVYCAEEFRNDGSAVANVVKAMKRVMALEYSRELSTKVSFGHARGAEQGFKQGSPMPYGVRGELVDVEGTTVGLLSRGQGKMLSNHRVRFVRGPPEELRTVRQIFRWRVQDGLSPTEIARRLIAAEVPPPAGSCWTRTIVSTLLKNELMTGVYTYGRMRSCLEGPERQRPGTPSRVQVFAPIVSPRLFKAAAAVTVFYDLSTCEMIGLLRRHIEEQDGRISQVTLRACPYVPSLDRLYRRFGSLPAAYAAAGFVQNATHLSGRFPGRAHTEAQIVACVRSLYERHGHVTTAMIDAADDLPSASWVYKQYGGVKALYARAGLPCDAVSINGARLARLHDRRSQRKRAIAPPRP